LGSLNNFWRSADNFQTLANYSWWTGAAKGMLWSVSQASPLRRVQVTNNLLLYQFIPGTAFSGYSSGGFTANVQVQGSVFSGSQQQWLSRSCDYSSWVGSNWNMVRFELEPTLFLVI
jgi:hypothetical protein